MLCIESTAVSGISEYNEAIASQYERFRRARVCCDYLSDVEDAIYLNEARWFASSTSHAFV